VTAPVPGPARGDRAQSAALATQSGTAADRAVLIQQLLDIEAIRFGEFTLKSGVRSPFYIDLRGIISYPAVLARVGALIATAVRRCPVDRIAGVPFAGVPLAVAASLAGNLPLLYPRPEEKAYGTRQRIEGRFAAGERVVVVDDIVTDGASKIEVIALLEAAGLVVNDLVVLIDREQGGGERLAAHGYALHPIVTISECFDELERSGRAERNLVGRCRDFLRAARSARGVPR
jgi:uridine monophosphate synthetase